MAKPPVVTAIEVHEYQFETQNMRRTQKGGIQYARGQVTHIPSVALKAHTDSGIVGEYINSRVMDAAAMRNGNYYELALVHPDAGPYNPPVYKSGYSDILGSIDKDGCVPVPEGPGLGVEYDWDYVMKHRTASTCWVRSPMGEALSQRAGLT